MSLVVESLVWSFAYAIIAAAIGILVLILSASIIPKLMNKLTPKINEEKEIVRGNRAVADYFGKIVQALIIGISMIIATAIFVAFY